MKWGGVLALGGAVSFGFFSWSVHENIQHDLAVAGAARTVDHGAAATANGKVYVGPEDHLNRGLYGQAARDEEVFVGPLASGVAVLGISGLSCLGAAAWLRRRRERAPVDELFRELEDLTDTGANPSEGGVTFRKPSKYELGGDPGGRR